MEIFRDLDSLQVNENCILTIGTFDGVHLGHQSIIHTLKQKAQTNNCCTTVVTFEPHPQFVIKPKKKNGIQLLTLIDEKIEFLKKLNVDRLIIIPFTPEFSRLSSRDFIEKILIKRIGFKHIIIGYDHAFGKNRDGNQELLNKLSETYNYDVAIVPPFSFENEIISSTKIRNLLSNGDVETAAKYMGRNYRVTGKVIHGEGRGRTLQIPTANLKPLSDRKLIPQNGIYAVWAHLGEEKLRSVLYIGTKPTFAHKEISIELHIFDFEKDLYDQTISIEFIRRLRDDLKFDRVENLIEQIEIDKKQTLELLNN